MKFCFRLIPLFFVVLLSAHVQAKTYQVKDIQLDGFRDEPAHHIFVKDIEKQLSKGLAKYKYRLSWYQMQYFSEYLTTWYKNAGLLFHKVIVPPQEIKNSQLILKLVPGVLGDISVRGNKDYSNQRIQSSFKPLLNKSVEKEKIEEALLILNDSPGLDVFSFFSRGKEKNETRINLKVQQEDAFEGRIKFDNYGTETTGENRALIQISLNNPTGGADQLSFGLLASDESLYGSLSYRIPLWNLFHTMGLSVSENEFDLAGDFTSLGVNGSTHVIRLDMNHTLFRGYRRNQKISWYIDQKDSSLDDSTGFNLLTKEETSQGVGINLLFDTKPDADHYQAYLNIYSGQYDSGFDTLDGESFNLANLVLSAQWQLLSSQSYFQSRLGLLLTSQFSDSILPSYEKFSLTGIDGVRAVVPGISSTDSGQLIRLSWNWTNVNWLGANAFSKKTRLSLFFESAEGEANDASVTESVSGYGLALDFLMTKYMTGRLIYAQSNEIDISTFTEEESSHAYAELVYRF